MKPLSAQTRLLRPRALCRPAPLQQLPYTCTHQNCKPSFWTGTGSQQRHPSTGASFCSQTPRVSITLATPKSATLTMPLSSTGRFAALTPMQSTVGTLSGADQKRCPMLVVLATLGLLLKTLLPISLFDMSLGEIVSRTEVIYRSEAGLLHTLLYLHLVEATLTASAIMSAPLQHTGLSAGMRSMWQTSLSGLRSPMTPSWMSSSLLSPVSMCSLW